MKSERRHDLQTNVLADWLGKKVTAMQTNAGWIVGGLLIIFVVVIFVFIRQNRLESAANEGWSRLQRATTVGLSAIAQQQPLALNNAVRDLEDIVRQYAAEPIVAYANLTLGDLMLQNGRVQYSLNKTAARDAFQNAARYYAAAAEAGSPDLKSRALFCQGKSLEWQMKLNQAQEIYRMVSGPYRSEAQARIRSLSRAGMEAFYKQYAEWKPKQQATDAKPDDKVDFELEDQSPPTSKEVDAALQKAAAGSGLEDSAGEVAPGGGLAPAETKPAESDSGANNDTTTPSPETPEK